MKLDGHGQQEAVDRMQGLITVGIVSINQSPQSPGEQNASVSVQALLIVLQ